MENTPLVKTKILKSLKEKNVLTKSKTKQRSTIFNINGIESIPIWKNTNIIPAIIPAAVRIIDEIKYVIPLCCKKIFKKNWKIIVTTQL